MIMMKKNNYFNTIIDKIWGFVKNTDLNKIEIINDCGDKLYYFKCKKYKTIWSRYVNDNFEDLNKHLSPERAYMYIAPDNIDELIKHCND